jgi:hypothetical protein
MKTIKLILTLALFIPFIGLAQTNKIDAKATTSDKIEAYYFHNTSRCITCKTVEAEAKQDIETLYPELVKQGKMSFQAVNLEEPSGKVLAEKLQISGQTLLLVKGTKQINITNEGFLYARTNPKKLKSIIKDKVDGLLEL